MGTPAAMFGATTPERSLVMRLVIVAATGGIGHEVLEQSLAAGHGVTAVVRDPSRLSGPVSTVAVDLAHPGPDALKTAVNHSERGVVGARPSFEVRHRRRLDRHSRDRDAMQATGTRRLVVVSAAPIGTVRSPAHPHPPRHDPGDGFFMRYLFAPLTKLALRSQYRDLAAMEAIVRDSGLDWTIVRPPRLTDKRRTGRYRTANDHNLRRGFLISRADVADLMLRVIGGPGSIHQVVGIAN
jgi:putative NADH-flavin reductase